MNKNGQLDKNIFGIPKEKYGFSNKANKPDYKTVSSHIISLFQIFAIVPVLPFFL
jgi:hypothetical protein